MTPRRTIARPPNSQSVAPGANAILVAVDPGETRNLDVYLVSLGTAIDPISNGTFATVRLLVNGQPFFPFNNMKSQIGELTQPKTFSPPVKLGHSVQVEVRGEMGAGAVGNTVMAAGFDLLVVPQGEKP